MDNNPELHDGPDAFTYACPLCSTRDYQVLRKCEGCGEAICYPDCYNKHMNETDGTCYSTWQDKQG